MFNLPTELVQHIFEFCIDKRLSWNKLNQQFLKGGFNRKNLKLNRYLEREQWCCKKLWGATRPEVSGEMKLWSPVTRRNELCSFSNLVNWNIKDKHAVVTFRISGRSIEKWSGKDPVSKWLKNISKFETSHPEYAKETYLPKMKSPIKVKCLSKFYVDRRSYNKKKRKRENEKKAASLFMEERKQLKLDKCSFDKNQEVLLSFTMSSGKLKFYRGWVRRIYLHQHRGGNGYRLIFRAPMGKNRFDALKIDNYIGELKITINFEDGESRQYTNHRLIERIQQSAEELIAEKKKEQIQNANQRLLIIAKQIAALKKESNEIKKIVLKEKGIVEGWFPDENIECGDEDGPILKKIMIHGNKYFIMSPDQSGYEDALDTDVIILDTKAALVGIYNKITNKITSAEWED